MILVLATIVPYFCCLEDMINIAQDILFQSFKFLVFRSLLSISGPQMGGGQSGNCLQPPKFAETYLVVRHNKFNQVASPPKILAGCGPGVHIASMDISTSLIRAAKPLQIILIRQSFCYISLISVYTKNQSTITPYLTGSQILECNATHKSKQVAKFAHH